MVGKMKLKTQGPCNGIALGNDLPRAYQPLGRPNALYPAAATGSATRLRPTATITAVLVSGAALAQKGRAATGAEEVDVEAARTVPYRASALTRRRARVTAAIFAATPRATTAKSTPNARRRVAGTCDKRSSCCPGPAIAPSVVPATALPPPPAVLPQPPSAQLMDAACPRRVA